MHKPDFAKRIIEGELDARKWRAEYMRPRKYAVTKIALEREPHQWITLPGIEKEAFATMEEMRAAVSQRVASYVASAGKA